MNYVVIATSNALKGTREFLMSTGRVDFTLEANEAARFVQEKSALTAIADLRAKDVERLFNVTLSYARVETKIVDEFEAPRTTPKPGFVLKITHKGGDNGKYHSAGRKVKSFGFSEARYKVVPNVDKATRFATVEEAQERLDLIHLTLNKVADQMRGGSGNGTTYDDIAKNFKAKIVKV